MDNPKVSIFIPTYRQITYLRYLLDSIQGQQFHDYEVIVNDDSPDDTVQQLVAHYPLAGRLIYFRNQPALGVPENWNSAIRRARGQYIKPMFHDDWFLHETSLGKFVALLDQNPAANFGFAVQKVWHMQTGHYSMHPLNARQQKKLAGSPAWLFFRNRVGVPSTTIFRQRLNQFYDLQLKYAVDWDFYLRAINTDHCFAYHPEPLVCVPVGLDFQVTKECDGNKSVELFEHAHIFNKLYRKRLDFRYFYYWVKRFYHFQVNENDPDYQRICRAYPSVAPYFAYALRGAKLIQWGSRLKQQIKRAVN